MSVLGHSRSSQFALAHRYDRNHPKADIVSRPALGAHARHPRNRGVRPCQTTETCSPTTKRTPWNKGKLIGARPPLRPKHVWSIRTRLLLEGRIRDPALFNLAIDSKLRGCDVVAVKVEDVAPNGYTMDRATVRQKKTGRPVKFELADQTRQAIDDY